MLEWASYLLVFLAGVLVGRALRGRPSEHPQSPSLPPPPLPADVDSQVRALLAERKKIEAIKLYRDSMGVGLKEAKDAVESMENRDPRVGKQAT